jgi:hypothetical protein
MVKRLPSKYEALSSNPSIKKKKKRRNLLNVKAILNAENSFCFFRIH